MTLGLVRVQAVELISEAVVSGAARFKARAELEISVRTYQRWIVVGNIKTDGDQMPSVLFRKTSCRKRNVTTY